MASKDKPKSQPGVRKGGKKSERRSAATIANKARRAEVRAARLERAAERRRSAEWTNPATGKKARAGTLKGKINSRAIQADRIFKKAAGRRLFKSRPVAEQIARREAGRLSRGAKALGV